jgi:hypothetical protein
MRSGAGVSEGEAHHVHAMTLDPTVGPSRDSPRFVDRLDSRLVNALTVLGLGLPVVAYFWFIHHYGVNVVWGDQWADINIIGQAHAGTLSVTSLWSQHFENRIFFPNLVVLLLAYTTHFNVVLEEYLSALMLLAATALLILTHRRRSPTTPWLYYCPVPFLMFTFAGGSLYWGGGNTLWGFQMAWYLVILALAVTVFLLDRVALGWLVMGGAIAAGIVGSYSSLQGLLIWPAGLTLLWIRRRRGALWIGWIAAALVTVAVYFYHYDSHTKLTQPKYVPLLVDLKYFLFAIGDNILGQQLFRTPHGVGDVDLVIGALILAIALWVVISTALRSDDVEGGAVGVTLVVVGLLCTASITAGRAWQGVLIANRYVTFEILTWVGCYLALIDRPRPWCKRTAPVRPPPADAHADSHGRAMTTTTVRVRANLLRRREVITASARWVLVVLIVMQVVIGTTSGLAEARSWYQREVVAADVTANIDKASDTLVDSDLGAYQDGSIRHWAQIAKDEHLTLFGTGAAATYAEEGLPFVTTAPVTRVSAPKDGARITGGVWMAAAASEQYYRLTSVYFRITGGQLSQPVVVKAGPTLVGWLGYWNATTVLAGSYTVESVATDAVGNRSQSAGVTVTVADPPPPGP